MKIKLTSALIYMNLSTMNESLSLPGLEVTRRCCLFMQQQKARGTIEFGILQEQSRENFPRVPHLCISPSLPLGVIPCRAL